MPTIEIDFDVYKALTMRRENEADSYNAVLRRLLELPASKIKAEIKSGQDTMANKTWVSKGVSFPEGTEFRANYKGAMYDAHVKGGKLVINANGHKGASSSLSHAARLVTNTSVDGWAFWEVKRPTDIEWRKCSQLRGIVRPSASSPLRPEDLL